jgi:hypothetical protein
MANLTLESKYKLKSGYEIPVLGYGVSIADKDVTRVELLLTGSPGLANVRWDQI